MYSKNQANAFWVVILCSANLGNFEPFTMTHLIIELQDLSNAKCNKNGIIEVVLSPRK